MALNVFELIATISVQNGPAKQALKDVENEGRKTATGLEGAFSKIGAGALRLGKGLSLNLTVF